MNSAEREIPTALVRVPRGTEESALNRLVVCRASVRDEHDIAVSGQRVFDAFFTDEIAYSVLPEVAKNFFGQSDSWRSCYGIVRKFMMFGWNLSRGEPTFPHFVGSAYHLWTEVDRFSKARDHRTCRQPELHEFMRAAVGAYVAVRGDWTLFAAEGRVRRLLESPAGMTMARRVASQVLGEGAPTSFLTMWFGAGVRFGYRVGEAQGRSELSTCLDEYRKEVDEVFFSAGFDAPVRTTIRRAAS